MTRLAVAAAVLVLAATVPTAEQRYFEMRRPVLLPAGISGQACVAIDAQTFPHATRGLEDLRLYNGSIETPYVLHQSRTTEQTEQQVAPTNLGERDGRTVFDAAMPAGNYNDLDLAISEQNFLVTVTVWGSQQPAGSQTKIGSYTIFDLTRERLGRSTVLHLPPSNFSWLHFQVAGPVTPDRVTGIAAVRTPRTRAKFVTVSASSKITQNGRDSVVEFNIPARIPVDRILFLPQEIPANFSREVDVNVFAASSGNAAENATTPPPANASGSLLRIHQLQQGHRLDEERLAIDAPYAFFDTESKWTVTVHNGDDRPLAYSSVRLEMAERDLCFEAAAGAQYALFYGDAALPGPHYDYARWFTEQPDAMRASLGPSAGEP